jgi:hypothetical protein
MVHGRQRGWGGDDEKRKKISAINLEMPGNGGAEKLGMESEAEESERTQTYDEQTNSEELEERSLSSWAMGRIWLVGLLSGKRTPSVSVRGGLL